MANFNLKSYFTFLSRNKAYTAVNVFGLAVSLTFVILIGVYTWQEFSVDRQHSKADRIYNIGLEEMKTHTKHSGSHHTVLRYIKKQYPEVEETCGFAWGALRLKKNENNMNILALYTDPTFFSMFDFPVLSGDRNTCLDGKGKIVVTQGFARRYFGTDDVVGRTVMTTDSLKFRVTAVVADFDQTILYKDIEALVDFSYIGNFNESMIDKNFPDTYSYFDCATFVQVREGCDFTKKEADVRKYFPTFWPTSKGTPVSPVITPLNKLYFSGFEADGGLKLGNLKMVEILFAVGLVILLFAIMNYINLTVAQSGYRAREMATRRLFGCHKGEVGVSMFTESLVMCLISCLAALALAYACAPHASSLIGEKLDMSVLMRPAALAAFAVFVVCVSLLAGAMPATILSKVSPIEVVRGTFTKQNKMVFSKVFIIVQNVITITMLGCALIMIRQMLHLIKAPMGFKTDNIIMLTDIGTFGNEEFPEFIDKVRALPAVKRIAESTGAPSFGSVSIGKELKGDEQSTSFNIYNATPDFMKIYGIRLKTDRHAKGRHVVYLNDLALKALHMKSTDTHLSERAKDLHAGYIPADAEFGGEIGLFRPYSILRPAVPTIISISDKIEWAMSLSIEVEGDQVEAYNQIKAIFKDVFHEEYPKDMSPFVDEQLKSQYEEEIRLGLVAMSTYFIQQRAREIAVRKVFGSTGGQVRRRLIRTFLAYVGIAFVIAAPITAYFINGWITQYSYRIVWWPYIILAGAIVLAISYAAVAVQSRVAASENPVKNIKQE